MFCTLDLLVMLTNEPVFLLICITAFRNNRSYFLYNPPVWAVYHKKGYQTAQRKQKCLRCKLQEGIEFKR